MTSLCFMQPMGVEVVHEPGSPLLLSFPTSPAVARGLCLLKKLLLQSRDDEFEALSCQRLEVGSDLPEESMPSESTIFKKIYACCVSNPHFFLGTSSRFNRGSSQHECGALFLSSDDLI